VAEDVKGLTEGGARVLVIHIGPEQSEELVATMKATGLRGSEIG